MYFVYLLRCADGTLYTGCTNDLARSRRPVVLVYREQAADRSAALRRERAIKRLTRKQKLELIQNSPVFVPEPPVFLQ